MKRLSFLLLILIATLSCASQQKLDWNSVSIQYTALSRGYFQKIEIRNQQIWISNVRKKKPVQKAINKSDWVAIQKQVEVFSLDQLSTFKAPTQERFHDGAPIGNLIITTKEKEYQTSGFDHGHPPKEIEKLVTLILKLNTTREQNSEE